jgi:hypothetical protein
VVLRPDAAAEGLTVADLRAFLAEQRNNIQAQQEVTRLQLKLVSLHEYIEGDDGCEGELTPSLRGHPAGV